MTIEQMTYTAWLFIFLAVICVIAAFIIFYKMNIQHALNTLKESKNAEKSSKSSGKETALNSMTAAQLLEMHREQDSSATVLLNEAGATTLLAMGNGDFNIVQDDTYTENSIYIQG